MNYTTTYFENKSQTALVITDDGNGGLFWGDVPLDGASINYETGEIVIPNAPLKSNMIAPEFSPYEVTQGQWLTTDAQSKTLTPIDVSIVAPKSANVSFIASPDTRSVQQTITTTLATYDVLKDLPRPNACVLNSWQFDIGGVKTYEKNGVLYQNWDYETNTGKIIGSLNQDGLLQLNKIPPEGSLKVKILQGVYVVGETHVKSFHGRIEGANIKPKSFTVYADIAGENLMAKADENETLIGSFSGKIDTATGYFHIESKEPIIPDTLRYNAVAQHSIPLDDSVIGINSARLPADGLVNVFNVGDMVVVTNKHTQNLGSAFSGSQTIELERKNLDRLCLIDNKGRHVFADQYEADLVSGSLTFSEDLSLSSLETPLFAVCIWEENNRIVEVDHSGSLKLQTPLKRDYPKENTFVSSAIIGGDLAVRATEPFTQNTWSNKWSDTRSGDDVLQKLNVKDYPIVLTSAGAITERWLILFTSQTQFRVIGERVGIVCESDTVTDLAPINPATDKPYFTIPAAAFGQSKWSSGYAIRFNTIGAQMPVWIIRAVNPSADSESKKDRFTLCLRGDTVEV